MRSHISYHALFYLVSVLLGKAGGAIAFNIVVPLLMSMVLTILDGFMKIENFSLGDYWIEHFMSIVQNTSAETGNIVFAIIASLVYTVVLFIVGMIINKKKQL